MEKQLVVFELSNEQFGVEIATVESIIKMQPITKVPHAPAFIEGVTNLRGKVLPVVDLRKRFEMSQRETTKDSRIVVVSIGEIEMGMVVDGVSEVLTLNDADVEPTPRMVTTIESTFITGIAKVNDRLIILLDLAGVLSMDEKQELQGQKA
jgi:purine-binding chemotaxis protein CheW